VKNEEEHYPEELLAAAAAIRGDGAAAVLVELNTGLKTFGQGFGAVVAVGLRCGQQGEMIVAAEKIAEEFAARGLSRAVDIAETIYRQKKEAYGWPNPA